MLERKEFEQLCILVEQLGEQLHKVALGTQALRTDDRILDLVSRVQQLRRGSGLED
jgi:hypothetical protein